jgi:hypothetical protein
MDERPNVRRVAGREVVQKSKRRRQVIVLVSIFQTAAAASSTGTCAPEVRRSVWHLSVTGQASDLRRKDC